MSDTSWYERLRNQYRPTRLRVLLIAESPPDPGSNDRRFFYSATLRADNLYRGVALAVYGHRADVDTLDKPHVLELLRQDGYWLIDAVEHPVNKHSTAQRRAAIRNGLPQLVERCRVLAPSAGVIVCHTVVYAEAADALRRAGVRVLHDEALPFPLGNWRAQFVAGFRAALAAAEDAAR